MATTNCLVCGRSYAFNDLTPMHFCSTACALDAGPVKSTLEYLAQRGLGRRVSGKPICKAFETPDSKRDDR